MTDLLKDFGIPIITVIISTIFSYIVAKKTLQSSNDLVIYQILNNNRKEVESAFYQYATNQNQLNLDFIELKKESFVNSLELLCKHYIENKIDRKTFRDVYKNDLSLVKEKGYSKFFDHLSPYQNTIILYKHLHQNYPLPRRIL